MLLIMFINSLNEKIQYPAAGQVCSSSELHCIVSGVRMLQSVPRYD